MNDDDKAIISVWTENVNAGAKGEPVIAGQAQHGPFEQMDIKRASLRLEFGAKPLSVKKVEVQEALPPAGVIGAEPLTLVPQHFPRKPA